MRNRPCPTSRILSRRLLALLVMGGVSIGTLLAAELARFPQLLVEEKSGRPGLQGGGGDTKAPAVVALLVPGICGEIQLRAVFIAAARLGQVKHLGEPGGRLVPLESWRIESDLRNVILIGRRDQLGGVELPADVNTAIAGLGPGQGLLAAFARGPQARQVFLVTGTDDPGLEKAALTLGSAPAMNSLGPSPARIDRTPIGPVVTEGGGAPVRIQNLQQVQEFLRVDPLARQAAVAVPAGPSLEQVTFLVGLGLQLGRSLSSAPVLWPLVVTYKPGLALDPRRMQGRNVLLLGAVSQWTPALPADAEPLALFCDSPEAEAVLIQGRRHKRSQFDAALAFAQLMPSPWSATNMLVCLGGWRDYAIPATRRMLLDPASPRLLSGELAAMDEAGRGVAMDLGEGGPSFVERLKHRLAPPSGKLEVRLARADTVAPQVRRWNRRLSLGFGAVLTVLVAARLGLMWQQTRRRKAALEQERRAGGIL